MTETVTRPVGVPAGPLSREPIRAAVADLLASQAVTPADLPFLRRVAAADPAGWSVETTRRVLGLLSTDRYRTRLEAAGWDVDLLAAPTTTFTLNVKVSVPTLTLTVDERVALAVPADHPVRPTVADLPGAVWDGHAQVWRFPITRRVAHRLRAVFTGVPVYVDPPAAARLRAAAAAPPTPEVTVTGDRVEVRCEPSRLLTDALRRLPATWDGSAGCWVCPPGRIGELLTVAAAHDLIVSPDVHARAAARNEPFDYDGTIDGLRGVPVTELYTVRDRAGRGKGGTLADRFAACGITTVYDLLTTVPRRYLDRSTVTPIRELPDRAGTDVGVLGRIRSVGRYDRGKRMVRFAVHDGTGELGVTFFHTPWLPRLFHVGDEVSLYGRVDVYEHRSGRRSPQMTNPVMDRVDDTTAPVVPIYPQSGKAQITTWDLHAAAGEAVRRLGTLTDPFPDDLVHRHGLLSRSDAVHQAHRPDTPDAAERARTRLAFDELFRMQLALGMRRAAIHHTRGVSHRPTGTLTDAYQARLPFPLTGAQQRVFTEILADLRQPAPMHRLLQGDVGSGKTSVAVLATLAAREGGFQTALMAPTDILAWQLYTEITEHCGGMVAPDGRPLTVGFLANRTRAADRRTILAGLADGSVDVAVGTHALLGGEVTFANLGLVIIDEQHRFGVEQRAGLRDKHAGGGVPDLLVMTATPIPRTAAMTLYGDLDVSVLDETPPGRQPVRTTWIPDRLTLDTATAPPWDLVHTEVAAGRQAYVVASLVEDNEKIAAASAEEAYAELRAGALHGLRVGLVHGQQRRAVRDAAMDEFRRGDLDVLVSTTVIEVGVNVPNATVIVILDAPRFGLAQLHQLRGRVGRGNHPAHCVLAGTASSPDGARRMRALQDTTDGFILADIDLDLRGEGSVFGARQSGETDLRVANLRDDRHLIDVCRAEASRMLADDPTLSRRPGLRTEVRAALDGDAETWLAKS